jgi:hypothetical protein
MGAHDTAAHQRGKNADCRFIERRTLSRSDREGREHTASLHDIGAIARGAMGTRLARRLHLVVPAAHACRNRAVATPQRIASIMNRVITIAATRLASIKKMEK